MKSIERLCLVGVFTVVVTTTTFAGDIHTLKVTPPPPNASSAITPGDIETPQATSDSAAEFALNLLQTMLSVF